MTLLQNALSAREALHRAEIALDNITRILFEEEEPPIDSERPAASPSVPDETMKGADDGEPSRPSVRPTVYQPALRGDVLVQLLLRHWNEANSEDKREAVRDLIKRCLLTDALTPTEYADLQARLK